MFLNKISEEKFLWNSIYIFHYMLRILWPIKNLAQINMNYEWIWSCWFRKMSKDNDYIVGTVKHDCRSIFHCSVYMYSYQFIDFFGSSFTNLVNYFVLLVHLNSSYYFHYFEFLHLSHLTSRYHHFRCYSSMLKL